MWKTSPFYGAIGATRANEAIGANVANVTIEIIFIIDTIVWRSDLRSLYPCLFKKILAEEQSCLPIHIAFIMYCKLLNNNNGDSLGHRGEPEQCTGGELTEF